jgi:D-alanine-D-alanine ligase
MRVVVLHNAVSQQDAIEDRDVLVQVNVVLEALKCLGHDRFVVACTLDLDSMKNKLSQLRPDVIFNLVETLLGDDSLIHLPPAVLDSLGLPYAGSRAEALLLTTHKLLAKERLTHAGLPTPAWIVQNVINKENSEPDSADCRTGDCPDFHLGGRTFLSAVCENGTVPSAAHGPLPSAKPKAEADCARWIIKGVWEQGSRDMYDDAVFTGDISEVRQRLRQRVLHTGRSAFAEQFVEGREFNLAMLTGPDGVEILPPAEIDFSAFPSEKPRIVGYSAKWKEDSFEYHNTPQRFDFTDADRPLLNNLRDLARQCWTLFNLRGWARVDFRVDQIGRPWILEVNANPCLSPDAGFVAALQQAGITFDEAIRRILQEV